MYRRVLYLANQEINMNKLLEFLVHSNIYLSLGAASVAYVVLFLLRGPLLWEPLLISFCSTFFLLLSLFDNK